MARGASQFVNSRQALRPSMLLPRRLRPRPYPPFDREDTRYFYLARNAVYEFARRNLEGAEVLFPAYCHGVELEALVAAGVRPKFYPVRRGMRVYADDVLRQIGDATRAIYLIHYLGFPGPVKELQQLSRERGLLLIEDCALSLLSSIGGQPLGSFGDASVYCLYKTLPLPHGGALYTSSVSSAETSPLQRPPLSSTLAYSVSSMQRYKRAHGNGTLAEWLGRLREKRSAAASSINVRRVASRHFDPADAHLGMSELCRWIIASLDLDDIINRRRENYAYLSTRLRDLGPPLFPKLEPGVCPLFYPLVVKDKEHTLQTLWGSGIEAVNFWSGHPSHIPSGMFPEAEALRRSIVELPCHQDLTIEHMDRIADRICESQRGVAVA